MGHWSLFWINFASARPLLQTILDRVALLWFILPFFCRNNSEFQKKVRSISSKRMFSVRSVFTESFQSFDHQLQIVAHGAISRLLFCSKRFTDVMASPYVFFLLIHSHGCYLELNINSVETVVGCCLYLCTSMSENDRDTWPDVLFTLSLKDEEA